MNLWTYDNILSHGDYIALMDEFRQDYNPWVFQKKEHLSYKCDGTKIRDMIGHIPYPKWGAIHKPSDQNGLGCLLYTSPSPRDKRQSRMPSSA